MNSPGPQRLCGRHVGIRFGVFWYVPWSHNPQARSVDAVAFRTTRNPFPHTDKTSHSRPDVDVGARDSYSSLVQSPNRAHFVSLVAVAFWDTNWPSAHVLHTVHEGRRWPSACWYDPLGQAVHFRVLTAESGPTNVPAGHTVCAVQRSTELCAGWYVLSGPGIHNGARHVHNVHTCECLPPRWSESTLRIPIRQTPQSRHGRKGREMRPTRCTLCRSWHERDPAHTRPCLIYRTTQTAGVVQAESFEKRTQIEYVHGTQLVSSLSLTSSLPD
jgi:hypothetical protein